MKRREFIAAVGGVAAWPILARAQQSERMRRVGVLSALAENDPETQARVEAFRRGMREAGWVEGRNLRLEIRWAGGDFERLQSYAAELVATKPDILFAGSGTALAPLYRETKIIPIVFAQVSDPVGSGFVASLAKPGGNVTGFAQLDFAVAAKWLELLKQIAPRVSRVAAIYDPSNPGTEGHLKEIKAGLPIFGVQLSTHPVKNTEEISAAITSAASEPNMGMIVLPGPSPSANRNLVIALAAKNQIPAVYGFRYWVADGGLASYGIDNVDLHRRAAAYVDRVLRGEKVGDLPVQNPSRYELVINLKTAKALGLDPPLTLLARTDEVIE